MKKDKKVWGWIDLPDKPHVQEYPFTLDSRTEVIPQSWKYELSPTIGATESDPWLQRFYDQRNTPDCVAFAWARVMSWWNKKRYDAPDFYFGCQDYDGLPDGTLGTTNYGAGLAAYYEGLREIKKSSRGNWQKKPYADKANGIVSWQWATSIGDIIFYGKPVPIGTKWYSGMMETTDTFGRYWVGMKPLGQLEGGHCYSIFAIDPELKLAGIVNNWGMYWSHGQLAWMPFELLGELLRDAECCLIVDRPGGNAW